ncbi:unnamed protein product (macronuclear) [Paramecium tetraurelia]|uniref:Uncharacterized protein n=1 Tax=Paramecium tetraurelia TaxID=5888 RepID=A0EC54_PARTE|nr:uncharacterized protein GSPATT00025607001 [Paramecium tetraurelia]CAK92871.1 unnamed protein product [Paramecium tetraurelia]|eukprot:XP_001460268.1 hypothetical protein (macronuclear) [Paramecium tetraurelia strain d4-2]
MIQQLRTSNTVQSSRDLSSVRILYKFKPKKSYSHFRKVLKARQKFPTSRSQHLRSEPAQTPKSPHQKITQLFQMTSRPERDRPIDEVRQGHSPNFYNLCSLPYKNYKYEKPPGNATVSQFLEQACKLGQKTGRWDKQSLIGKFNPDKQHSSDILFSVQIKRSTYTSDHLIKSRKVQGPASCLETIYVAKLQLDLEDNQDQEIQHKVNEIEETLKEGVKYDKTKCASQQYILNRWTRQQVSQDKLCLKNDKLPQFAYQKYVIDQSINKVVKSSSQYTTQEQNSITQLPEKISFFKFDFKQKNFQKQLYYNKGQTVALLKQNYPFLQKPIIGNRILLSFDIVASQENIPYRTFCTFLQVYENKKIRVIEGAIDTVTKNIIVSQILKFFVIDLSDIITSLEFCNLIRILCQQLNEKHPTIQPIYQQLIQNYQYYQIISEDLSQPFNSSQFKFIYLTNEMNIDDIIDLITLI